jgi:hypothetical protein
LRILLALPAQKSAAARDRELRQRKLHAASPHDERRERLFGCVGDELQL